MRSIPFKIFLPVLALLLSGCSFSANQGAIQTQGIEIVDSALHNQAMAILQNRCASCHSSGSAIGGTLTYITDIEALYSNSQVVPGNPTASNIYITVANGSMPPMNSLLLSEVQTLSDWITRGIRVRDDGDDGGGGTPTPAPLVAPSEFPVGANDRTRLALTILNTRCVSCHNSSTGNATGGGINNVLDPRQMLIAGLIVPGNPTASPLYDAIRNYWMPPTSPMAESEINAIRDWIQLDLTANPAGMPSHTVVPLTASFSSIRSNILATRCLICHGGLLGTADGVDVSDYNSTRTRANALLQAMNNGSMPQRYNPITQAERTIFQQWINAGTPNN